MKIRILPNGRVKCEAALPVSLSAGRAWGQLRDFHRYAAHDHFHAGFAIEGGAPRAGARLQLDHRYGPFRVRRVGRILRWREGSGFAYSDLSRSGLRVGFPHVMQFSLHPQTSIRCSLLIRVTGRWTAPVPRFIARLWLRWVMSSIARRVENDLLMFQLAVARA